MRFLWLVLFCIQPFLSFAQSCCCVGTGAGYSILPNINRHLAGVRYTHRQWQSTTSSINPELDGRTTRQLLHSAELIARFNLWHRLQITAAIPYVFLQHRNGAQVVAGRDLGDIALRLRFQLLNPNRCNGKISKHQLITEGGVKFPTGTFEMLPYGSFNTPAQSGTGSVDALFNITYTYRYRGWGTNIQGGYRLNTPNRMQYRFGDMLQIAPQLFYLYEHRQFSLMPALGLRYEHAFLNRFKNQPLDYTGGDFLFATAGVDVYYRQFAFTTAIAPALWNRLNWSGEYRNRFSIEAGAFYNF